MAVSGKHQCSLPSYLSFPRKHQCSLPSYLSFPRKHQCSLPSYLSFPRKYQCSLPSYLSFPGKHQCSLLTFPFLESTSALFILSFPGKHQCSLHSFLESTSALFLLFLFLVSFIILPSLPSSLLPSIRLFVPDFFFSVCLSFFDCFFSPPLAQCVTIAFHVVWFSLQVLIPRLVLYRLLFGSSEDFHCQSKVHWLSGLTPLPEKQISGKNHQVIN